MPEGVRVVGVDAHNVAVGVGVEEADGEGLHLHEEIVTYLLEHFLAYDCDDTVVKERPERARQIDCGHDEDDAQQAAEEVLARLDHLEYVVVDDDLHEGVAHHRGHDANEDADND